MKQPTPKLGPKQWRELADAAWDCREHAYVIGSTAVGAAALSSEGKIFAGCNVEHPFRSHDVHAEINAITSMIADGGKRLLAIVIVAERKRFTPCGACMDWIFQFGGPSCIVGYQSKMGGTIRKFRARDLMPYYPL